MRVTGDCGPVLVLRCEAISVSSSYPKVRTCTGWGFAYMVGNTVCSGRAAEPRLGVNGAVCYAVRLLIRGGEKRYCARAARTG